MDSFLASETQHPIYCVLVVWFWLYNVKKNLIQIHWNDKEVNSLATSEYSPEYENDMRGINQLIFRIQVSPTLWKFRLHHFTFTQDLPTLILYLFSIIKRNPERVCTVIDKRQRWKRHSAIVLLNLFLAHITCPVQVEVREEEFWSTEFLRDPGRCRWHHHLLAVSSEAGSILGCWGRGRGIWSAEHFLHLRDCSLHMWV